MSGSKLFPFRLVLLSRHTQVLAREPVEKLETLSRELEPKHGAYRACRGSVINSDIIGSVINGNIIGNRNRLRNWLRNGVVNARRVVTVETKLFEVDNRVTKVKRLKVKRLKVKRLKVDRLVCIEHEFRIRARIIDSSGDFDLLCSSLSSLGSLGKRSLHVSDHLNNFSHSNNFFFLFFFLGFLDDSFLLFDSRSVGFASVLLDFLFLFGYNSSSISSISSRSRLSGRLKGGNSRNNSSRNTYLFHFLGGIGIGIDRSINDRILDGNGINGINSKNGSRRHYFDE